MPRYATRNFATRLGRISTRAEWTAIMALLKRGMPIVLIMKILEHNRVGGQGKWAVVRRAVIAWTVYSYWYTQYYYDWYPMPAGQGWYSPAMWPLFGGPN
jgi:hypothetical protein